MRLRTPISSPCAPAHRRNRRNGALLASDRESIQFEPPLGSMPVCHNEFRVLLPNVPFKCSPRPRSRSITAWFPPAFVPPWGPMEISLKLPAKREGNVCVGLAMNAPHQPRTRAAATEWVARDPFTGTGSGHGLEFVSSWPATAPRSRPALQKCAASVLHPFHAPA
jgi:hypothetical protein